MRTCLFFLILQMLMVWQEVRAIRSKEHAIHMNDVRSLTFHKNQYTTARRVEPLNQLLCIGGSAHPQSRNDVNGVTCENKGFDGKHYRWRCELLPPQSGLAIRQPRISCEGYDTIDDPYILIGSCSLQYKLDSVVDATSTSTSTNYYSMKRTQPIKFYLVLVLLFSVAVGITALTSSWVLSCVLERGSGGNTNKRQHVVYASSCSCYGRREKHAFLDLESPLSLTDLDESDEQYLRRASLCSRFFTKKKHRD